jgi:hypothetical protein
VKPAPRCLPAKATPQEIDEVLRFMFAAIVSRLASTARLKAAPATTGIDFNARASVALARGR